MGHAQQLHRRLEAQGAPPHRARHAHPLVTLEQVVTKGVYQCPVYGTTIRGPTHIFPAPMRIAAGEKASKWILAAVCLLFQPDM